MNGKMIYSDIFHLTQGDFDQYLRIKPYAVFNLFQEAAVLHANMLHAGYNDLIHDHKLWMLLRSKYVIVKQPQESQKVKIETWPLPSTKVEYTREYRILDMDNNILIKGTSKWCIIDLETKMISRKGIEFNGEYYSENNFDVNLDKLPNVEIEQNNLVYTHQVQISDLDRNFHMNNAKYSEIILNALELKEDEIIHEIQINFINEMKLNEKIKVYKTKLNGDYYIVGCKEDKVAFRAHINLKH